MGQNRESRNEFTYMWSIHFMGVEAIKCRNAFPINDTETTGWPFAKK